MSRPRPRALVIAPRFPLPLRSGTQIREYHVLRALLHRCDVTLVSLIQSGEGENRASELQRMGVELMTIPHDRTRVDTLLSFAVSRRPYRSCKFATPAFRDTVRSAVTQVDPDVVWANFHETADLVPVDVDAPVVVDTHNSAVGYWSSYLTGRPWERLFARVNIRRLDRFLERLSSKVDGVVAVSEGDADDAREWTTRETHVGVLPNGVDVDEFVAETAASGADERVVFVGSLDVRMNVEAVSWFVEHAWPHVRKQCPDAVFDLVGRSPSDRIRSLGEHAGVNLVGEVEDVRPYYERAAVAIAPFAHGGGSKLKVLESMSMARPLVATPAGTIGVDLPGTEPVAVVPRGSQFADAVSDFLRSPAKRDRVGSAARDFVEANYAWDIVAQRGVDDMLSDLGILETERT